MADDIRIKLGLDTTELFAGLNKVTTEAQKTVSTIGNTKVDINEGPIIADLNKIEAEAKETGAAMDKGLGGGLEGIKGKIGGLTGGLGDLGGSFQSLTGGVTSLVPGLGSLSGVLAGGGITAGIAAIGGGIAFAIEKGKAFETQLASLSSITGVSGPALDDLGEKAKAMASKFGTEATANIESFKTILSKLGPDIAKSPEALNSMAESVNTLSKATGDDPGKATEALTGALLQFGVSLDDPVKAADAMAVAMNVLAAGAKEGASEVPDVAAAINVAGVAASSAKVSFEETNSAIQVLAAGGKVGAEAGTSLRNVLNKLGEGRFLPKDVAKELGAAGVDINKLGDTTISFSERLRELNKISGDAALKTKLFGTDAAAASILIKGANGSMDDLTKKITGTNTAYDQAAINMNTFDESLNRIKSNVDNFAISFYDGMMQSFGMLAQSIGPSVTELMENMSGYFTRMWTIVQPILAAIGAWIMWGINNVITVTIETLNLFYEQALYAFDGIVGALKPLYDAIMSALGLDGAMGQGIDGVKMLQQAMDFTSAAISAIFDVLQSLSKILIDVVVFAFSKVISIITTVIETVAAVGRAIFDFVKSLPGVETAISGLQSAFNAVYGFFANLPGVINETQAYLKAIGGTFQAVFNIIGEAFTAALNLDFGGAAAKLSSVFESQTWVSAFSSNLSKARSELKQTGETAKKTGDEFIKFQTQTAAGAAPKGASEDKKGKKDESFEALEKLKKQYANEQTIIENANLRELEKAREQGKDLKVIKERQAREEEDRLKLFLNKAIGDVDDANILLNEKQLVAKIKPANPGQFAELESFYLNAINKLNKDAKIEPKVKLPDFKDELKGFETAVKDIEKNTEALIPKVLANSQEALDANTSQVTKYLDFIKSQNAEIEQAKTEALASGNIKAAESFDAQIQRNVLSINTLTSRLATYQTDSSKAIKKAEEESTLAFQLTTALQTNILDVFNSERIAKEREANEAIRAEKLGALDQEENDLTTSLAKREVSFEEYAAKMADIDKARQDAMEATETTFMERMKGALDQTVGNVLKGQATAINTYVSDQFKDTEGNVSESGKIIGNMMGNLATQFGELALSGKATLADFARSSVMVAYQALQQMIPIFIAEIAGKQFAELGLLGIAAAAGLTIVLNGLFAAAAPSLGFKDGVVDLAGPGTETSDSIPAWLSKGESVITASSTRANKEELAWMNNNPGMSIRDYFTSHAPQVRYSVDEDGGLIREVQKLREETRGLGRQINRNTHVSISGELRADNNSIKAVIDNERRRNARRG